MTAFLLIVGVIVLGWVVRPVVGALLGQQVKGSIPDWTAAIARSAARHLPQELREDYECTWLAELDALRDKPLSGLRFALGLRKAARGIAGTRRRVTRFDVHAVVNRATDIGFSFASLLLLAPVFLALALAIILSVGRAFTFLPYCGKGGRTIRLSHFRVSSASADGRASSIGRFIWRVGLYRLPLLINILRGDIALIGPPPIPAWRLDPSEPEPEISVRPGFVSWEDIPGIPLSEARERDRNRTLARDVQLMLVTFSTLMRRR